MRWLLRYLYFRRVVLLLANLFLPLLCTAVFFFLALLLAPLFLPLFLLQFLELFAGLFLLPLKLTFLLRGNLLGSIRIRCFLEGASIIFVASQNR